MPHIHVMDKALADLIAAGEVVERPASVVKELIENAIDAGATQVTAEIRDGGSTYIRVTDDGCGIPKEEMATAFLRHATSKISTAQDLDSIATLGFRGEALAAIAAVARVQMLSKTREQEIGYSYTIECSEAVEEGDAGCGDGTTVVVRDLFFFHPARYKYLKKDVAEGNAVQNVVDRQALGHPEVSFRFIRDGRPVFTTPGDGEPLAVIHTLMPDEARNMLFVQPYGYPGLRVFGYVSRPSGCKGSRAGQHFFVNGRWIQAKKLTAALEKAYENQKMVGKFPACVLYLEIAADKVDVNAHPAKTEVRFLQENDLFGLVFRAVGAELMMAEDRPELRTAPKNEKIYTGEPERTARFGGETKRFEGVLEDGRGDFEDGGSATAGGPGGEEKTVGERAAFSGGVDKDEVVIPPGMMIPPNYTTREEHGLPVDPTTGDVLLVLDSPEAGAKETGAGGTSGAEPPWEGEAASLWEQEDGAPAAEPWRMVGEVLNTYIIVEQGEKILFIDKHAAHERMGFDALKAQGGRPMAQALLKPLSLTPRRWERDILLEHAGELEEFGFQLEAWGDGGLLVRTCPDFLDPGHIPATLEELAAQYSAAGSADPDSQRDALLHVMACKGAMKGGQRNQAEELFVIAKAVMEGKVSHCPHGRPVATELTKTHLERQFGRA